MAVSCTTSAPSSTIVVNIAPLDLVENDLILAVAGFDGTAPSSITPDVDWFIQIASGNNDSSRFQIWAGRVPSGALPATISFTCGGGDYGAIVFDVIRGSDTNTLIGESDVFSDFTNPAQLNISVGPVSATVNGSQLYYIVGAIRADAVNFDSGPTPAVAEIQTGATSALNPSIHVGIWAEAINAGDSSGVLTQTINSTDETTVNGLAMAVVINAGCLT